MKTKTNLKAGGRRLNNNQTLARDKAQSSGLKVKTNLKAGGRRMSGQGTNHNQTLVRETSKPLGM